LRSGHQPALTSALKANRAARAAWAELAQAAKGVYRDDITFGPEYFQRGHWLDRLPAMDADIADMEKLLAQPPAADAAKIEPAIIEQAMRAVLVKPKPDALPSLAELHTPPVTFQRGQPLSIVASCDSCRDFRAASTLSPCQSIRNLADGGDGQGRRGLWCGHTGGIHKFPVPVAILFPNPHRERSCAVASRL